MSFLKKQKDNILRSILGSSIVPRGLFELNQYFRIYQSIKFDFKPTEDGIVAISSNFRYGSIVTTGRDERELDLNIKDAILTSFEIPSSYAKEAKIRRIDEKPQKQKEYALA